MGSVFQAPIEEEGMMEWWLQLRHGHNSLKQKGIDFTFMLITWSIWKERNSRTFDSAPGRYEMHMVEAVLSEGQL
uniref:Uncharacterized protein n=1 Tax=Setaria italica TaxID=4555 RepID=K3Y0W6_SETIT